MFTLIREWWDGIRPPRRRSTFVERGPIPFRGEHRAGRPELKGGVGSETRPLYIHELDAHKAKIEAARKARKA
jgi:hypothetical protein